jgi:outer membrane lipoprotein carrier protein
MLPRRTPSTLCTAAGVGIALLLAAAAPARAETAGRLLACVQARYGALADLAARFTQESRVATLGQPRQRAGRILFQAKGRMRWEYDPPEAQLLVADGETVWFHRPEQKQVVVQKIAAAFTRQTPLLFLFGRGDFAAEFTWDEGDLAPGPGGTVSIALRPKVESPELARLVLEVAPGDCRLTGSTLEDAFGNVTRLAFTEERANPGLDPALFRFTVPSGTEVLRP